MGDHAALFKLVIKLHKIADDVSGLIISPPLMWQSRLVSKSEFTPCVRGQAALRVFPGDSGHSGRAARCHASGRIHNQLV